MNASGISPIEPKRENFDDEEDFVAAWLDWADEYPAMAKKSVECRYETD